MSDSGLNLTDVVQSVRKHKSLIIGITFAATVAGVIFYYAGPKKYEAKTEFILRNPLYGDRNNLYNNETKFLDYFASEDDVDRLMLMAGSDLVQSQVIKNTHLAEAYGIDTSNRKGEHQLAKKFEKNFNITRTEYKDLLLSYDDTDPERAATVANECVKVLESTFGNYYRDMRKGMYMSIVDNIHREDSTIDALTDSLSALREQYGIYDIISPARNNIMLSPMKDNGHKNYGKGIELVQNIESLKDQIVSDRARQTTLVNQYKTGLGGELLPMLKVVTEAKPAVSPKGIGGLYTLLVSALLGFFFSTMLVSFTDRYVTNPERK